MGLKSPPGIAIVTRPTRLAGLRQRWVTASQAKFLLKQAHAIEAAQVQPGPTAKRQRRSTPVAAEADFEEYEREDAAYRQALERLHRELDFGLPIRILDRSFVPNFDFWSCAVVVVVGQDGLVANTAKYVGGLPIVAVNPDPERIDGILLPYQVHDARRGVKRVLDGKFQQRSVTLAEVNLNDGQKMLAFNDFFLGAKSHVSARYTIAVAGHSEPQSSSGVLVSTGAGSTGWVSSVFNMTAGVAQLLGGQAEGRVQLPWEDRRLIWAVREPFVSKSSQAGLVAGLIAEGDEIVLESLMPEGGVIFSDGIEADFLPFNSGTIARVAASTRTANLVTD